VIEMTSPATPAPDGQRPLPAPGETLDRLAGEWRVFQLRRGHRYATDDVLVAWTATRARPEGRRLLDLGAGVGSVGLMALLRAAPEAQLTSVEAQGVSARLQRKTVAFNGLEGRVEVRRVDLREPDAVERDGRYDLVTANPPFLAPGTALVSPVPQRAGARMELRGDIFDFCRVAASALAADGRFCFCHAAADPRPQRAVAAAGLTLRARQDVLFRARRAPTIALFTCAHQGQREDPPPLVVRGEDGRWTETFRAVRREMLIEA